MSEKQKKINIDPFVLELLTDILTERVCEKLREDGCPDPKDCPCSHFEATSTADMPDFKGGDSDVDGPEDKVARKLAHEKQDYYTSGIGDFECFDVMVDRFGVPAVAHFAVCNAFKYLWRCKFKHANPLQDLKKAHDYLGRAVTLYAYLETLSEQNND